MEKNSKQILWLLSKIFEDKSQLNLLLFKIS